MSSSSSHQTHVCFHTNRYLIISLLFLLIANMAEGRTISKLLEVSQKGIGAEKAGMVMQRSLIGSRPPSCERICSSCGHCTAIQVPITTKVQGKKSRLNFPDSSVGIAYSRGDDVSNYKPISWKCKCGDLIINPWLKCILSIYEIIRLFYWWNFISNYTRVCKLFSS